MLRLKGIFKNYEETGSLGELVNLYGFIDRHVFVTKTGDLGVVLQINGVDYERLDGNALDALTKRLESALKLFDENYRIYQYLFKRNHKTIPYNLYGNRVVDTAIQLRLLFISLYPSFSANLRTVISARITRSLLQPWSISLGTSRLGLSACLRLAPSQPCNSLLGSRSSLLRIIKGAPFYNA
jgi:hypothetical protein